MKNTTWLYRYKLWHVLFWLLLLATWYYLRYDDFVNKELAFRITLLKVAELAIMVYVTNYLLIPRLLYKKHYLLFGILFLLWVAGMSWLKMYLEGLLMHNPTLFDLRVNLKRRIYDNTIPHLLLVSTGAAFKLLLDYARAQRRIGEMAKEHAETELNFLKSQVNPHFVFNSLNSIYFLIDKQNTMAREALHKFSGMLRYQLYECNGNSIALMNELAYLQNYIDLQQLRRGDDCQVQFTYPPSLDGIHIAPLLLVPLVENAFKHLSATTHGENRIIIALRQEPDRLIFSVYNTTDRLPKNAELVKDGGIGLANVKRRLALLYPNKHRLTIVPGTNSFSVELELPLT